MQALTNCNYIREENNSAPNKIGLTRVSRTDKGVSAAMTCLSFKIDVRAADFSLGEDEDFDKMGKLDLKEKLNKNFIREKLNEELTGSEIRILGIRRVGKKFALRKKVLNREYKYLLPTKCFYKWTTKENFSKTQNS